MATVPGAAARARSPALHRAAADAAAAPVAARRSASRTADRGTRCGPSSASAVVFAVFFALVMFHTVLLQNQRRLDQLDTQVRGEQATYQQLRLQVAQLQSPERILEVATTKLGLVPSNGTTYLTPSGRRRRRGASGAGREGRGRRHHLAGGRRPGRVERLAAGQALPRRRRVTMTVCSTPPAPQDRGELPADPSRLETRAYERSQPSGPTGEPSSRSAAPAAPRPAAAVARQRSAGGSSPCSSWSSCCLFVARRRPARATAAARRPPVRAVRRVAAGEAR